MTAGFVYLIGAGPGDPNLITTQKKSRGLVGLAITRIAIATLALILYMCTHVSAASHQPHRSTDARKSAYATLIKIKQAASHDQIERLQVFHLPPSIETIIGLSPGSIETNYKYKIEIASLNSDSEEMESLCKAIDHTEVAKPLSGFYDFRWGCKFYNRETKEIYTIYLDRWGQNAVINHQIVSLKGEFYPWLKSHFFFHQFG